MIINNIDIRRNHYVEANNTTYLTIVPEDGDASDAMEYEVHHTAGARLDDELRREEVEEFINDLA